jgi:hypothetical protein
MKVLHKQENSKLINYELYEIAPKIYAVLAKDSFERAMLFLRAQEYYESPFPEFRGQDFDIFVYMNRYRKERSANYFSYTADWSGYNVPSESLEACMRGVYQYHTDITSYDHEMTEVVSIIRQYQKKGKFYLLGVDSLESRVMDHEFAHGLFYTNKAYKTEMMELVLSLKRDLYEQLESYLIQIGYTSHVIADEIQAYMATGLTATMAKTRGSVTAAKKFEKIFKKYKKQYGKHDNINNPKRQAAEQV